MKKENSLWQKRSLIFVGVIFFLSLFILLLFLNNIYWVIGISIIITMIFWFSRDNTTKKSKHNNKIKPKVPLWLMNLSWILVFLFFMMNVLADVIIGGNDIAMGIGMNIFVLLGGLIAIACAKQCYKWSVRLGNKGYLGFFIGFFMILIGLLIYYLYYKYKIADKKRTKIFRLILFWIVLIIGTFIWVITNLIFLVE